MHRTPDTYEALVVGGGLVGLCCALALQDRGMSVAVIDPGDPRARASFGNAGVISRGSILPVAGPGARRALLRYALARDPGVRVRWRSLPRLAPWLAAFLRACDATAVERAAEALNPLAAAAYGAHERLASLVGTTHLLRRRGWLRLYRTPAAFAASAGERRILERHGVAAETVAGPEIRELEPALADRYAHGLLFPQTGAVEDPGALVAACEAAFRARGGAVIAGRALAIEPSGQGVAVNLPGRRLAGACAVLAAGAWSDGLARSLGLRIPFAAEGGSHVHVGLRGNHGLSRPVNDTGGGWVASPAGGTVRLLTGVRLARADDAPDDRQLRLVLADAARTLPLGDPVPGTEWHGGRPSTPDGLPVIGPAPGAPRVILAFGHGHVGFSTAPVTAGIVADLATGRAPAIPMASFAAERFARAPR